MKKPKTQIRIVRLDPDSPRGKQIATDLKQSTDAVYAYKAKHGLKSVEGLVMGAVPHSLDVESD